jgi:hypothetical protein
MRTARGFHAFNLAESEQSAKAIARIMADARPISRENRRSAFPALQQAVNRRSKRPVPSAPPTCDPEGGLPSPSQISRAADLSERSGRDDEAPMPRQLPAAALRALEEAERRRSKANPLRPMEINGRGGPEPVRYGDWEVNGLATDF